MENLEELKLILDGNPRNWRVEPSTFRGLEQLRKLEITGLPNRRHPVRIHLTTQSLGGAGACSRS